MSNLTIQETFKQRISENLRSQFMELIPSEMLDQLTASALDEFLNGSPNKRHNRDYNPSNDPDTLKGMIMTELKSHGREQILEVLQRPEWKGVWNPDTSGMVSTAVSEIITANADVFVQSLFKTIISNAMQGVMYNMKSM